MNKITEKIKKIVESNRNLTNVASGDFISNVVGALFWLYIAVLLTPEEYGEVSFLVSVAAFASTLSMVGAYNSIVVLTAKDVKIQVEMINRFGLLPDEIKHFFLQAELRLLSEENSVIKINFIKDKINVFFKNSDLDTSIISNEDIESKVNMTKDVIKAIVQNVNKTKFWKS